MTNESTALPEPIAHAGMRTWIPAFGQRRIDGVLDPLADCGGGRLSH